MLFQDYLQQNTFLYLNVSNSPCGLSHKKKQTFLSSSWSDSCSNAFLRSPTTLTLPIQKRNSMLHNSGKRFGPFSRASLRERPPSDWAEASCTMYSLVVSQWSLTTPWCRRYDWGMQPSGKSSMCPSLRRVLNWLSYAVYSLGAILLTVQWSLVSQTALLSAKLFRAWSFQGHDTTYFPASSHWIMFFTSSSRSRSNTSSCATPRWSKDQKFCSCSWTEAQNAQTWVLTATPANGKWNRSTSTVKNPPKNCRCSLKVTVDL